ncbi:MAG: zinc ribbon domain-containing protein [Actinobacteria bacterium]|nr:zinc ribbon domain-containing protein [Actinomycetota bacterium]MBA3565579.1 zinc ribbon domain-containing protein [Actinomycetota bacterium]
MPIYEYRCPNGHTFEVFQKMAEAPIELCVTCGKGPVEKILFPVAVHFKGSGFYSTDYGRRGKDKDGDSAAADKPTDKVKPAEKAPASEKKTSPPPSD